MTSSEMTTDMQRAEALLKTITQLTIQQQATRGANLRNLLRHPLIRDHLTRQRLRRQLTTERHNIFDALCIARREIYHSRFIGYLFDPNARHDQHSTFLRSFLAWLLPSDKIPDAFDDRRKPNSWWSATRVTPELHAGEFGRIDLVIELPDGTVIAIENKVDAGEQPEQIKRYSEGLRTLHGKQVRRLILVFLTPDGREPTTAAPGDEVIPMSYHDLAACLEKGLEELSRYAVSAIPLIATTRQYIDLCRRLADGDTEMADFNAEILELLHDEKTLETALDLKKHLEEVEKTIQSEFMNHFVGFLSTRLEEIGMQNGIWKAAVTPKWHNCAGLIPMNTSAKTSNYQCIVGFYFSPNAEIGWRRPEKVDPLQYPYTNNINHRMEADKLGNPSWEWLCSTSLHPPQWSSLTAWKTDNILAINADNRSKEHDLARALADHLWERYFLPYHAEIERLPDFRHPNSA